MMTSEPEGPFPSVNIADYSFQLDFIQEIPISFARTHLVLAMIDKDGNEVICLGDIANWQVVDSVCRLLGRRPPIVLAEEDALRSSINRAYEQDEGRTERILDTLEPNEIDELISSVQREDLMDTSARAPVVRLANSILFEAVAAMASDVHFQPHEEQLVVRIRVDGILHDVHKIPKSMQEEVLSRIKVFGGMDIAEKRMPQDGRATAEVGNRCVDLRIASIPTSLGERVVVRILDKSSRLYDLSELGMSRNTLEQLIRLIHSEHGMILVTGPTGSGKSTTLYSALRTINSKDRNILTVEDPIEFQLEGISQTQVNVKKGMTFAAGLRSILRQDPDVIMVGEIRDQETAIMAIQSALTGHLVFSTLHTNDAASAVTRLLDLGIEPFLIASSLKAVLAQRLVRRNCAKCSIPSEPTPDELDSVGASKSDFAGVTYRGKGCEFCRLTGYRGRFALTELLNIDSAIRKHIQASDDASQVASTAIQHGMTSLRDDGFAKISMGLTTVSEVARITGNFKDSK